MTRLLMLALCTLTGCQRYYFTDSVDLELDFDFIVEDEIHSPYVVGAEFAVWANSVEDTDWEDWTITSSDPSVLSVTRTEEDRRVEVIALAEGDATIELYDSNGNLVHAEDIEVRAPASAELMWHGDLLLGAPEDEAVVDEANILVGGTGTFLVRWFDDQGRRLNGHRALTATATGVDVFVAQTYLFEDRDWLQITALEEGTFEVEIAAEDLPPIASFTVTAVPSIEGITLEAEPEQGQAAGTWLVVVATGVSADGEPVYGVEYSWDADGESLIGLGDLLRYEYSPNMPVMVGANFGAHRAETMVHAEEFDVDSTNDLGCSAAGASAVPLASMPLLIGLGLIWRARRRR